MGSTIVVVGGGYGGTAVAKALEAEALDAGAEGTGALDAGAVEIVLIDPGDAFVNVAGSLRALVQPSWAPRMFFPYATALTRTTVLRDRVVSVDPRGVVLQSGRRVDADYLVLATGSRYAYPARPTADATDEALDELRRTHKELAGARRVLIAGAGPVGLELAGEIREVWPDMAVTVVDPAGELLAGYEPALRDDLRRQLTDLGVDLRLGTALTAPPPVAPGQAATFTVTTTGGDEITADLWFQAHGARANSDYLAEGRLTTLTARGQVAVTEHLNVRGYSTVYAIGDLTDVAEEKLAAYALAHAEIVAGNIGAQLRGLPPTATYQPRPYPIILLPLGPRGGVGQMPGADGPAVVPAAVVTEYKGTDLFTARFLEQFGPTAA
ncbi:NAD(P)/FAD-dependent oxidoreductase [Parafrankia sp. FMc2]|uniref:NAD(P)/FAD-dependent oxidoreductase n=1 Tax=Parafrankia sp. FMc2 TaxID=3233196 RepID=UPI0034D67A27